VVDDAGYPSRNSYAPDLRVYDDGAIDLPRSRTTARVRGQLNPHPAQHRLAPILRRYGPTEVRFDQSWKPGRLEAINI
jgi:hypothetical protein